MSNTNRFRGTILQTIGGPTMSEPCHLYCTNMITLNHSILNTLWLLRPQLRRSSPVGRPHPSLQRQVGNIHQGCRGTDWAPLPQSASLTWAQKVKVHPPSSRSHLSRHRHRHPNPPRWAPRYSVFWCPRTPKMDLPLLPLGQNVSTAPGNPDDHSFHTTSQMRETATEEDRTTSWLWGSACDSRSWNSLVSLVFGFSGILCFLHSRQCAVPTYNFSMHQGIKQSFEVWCTLLLRLRATEAKCLRDTIASKFRHKSCTRRKSEQTCNTSPRDDDILGYIRPECLSPLIPSCYSTEQFKSQFELVAVVAHVEQQTFWCCDGHFHNAPAVLLLWWISPTHRECNTVHYLTSGTSAIVLSMPRAQERSH